MLVNSCRTVVVVVAAVCTLKEKERKKKGNKMNDIYSVMNIEFHEVRKLHILLTHLLTQPQPRERERKKKKKKRIIRLTDRL